MYYEFYIDQFFVEHLLIGCLLLSAALALQKRTAPTVRILLGSIAGSAVMCMVIIAGLPAFYFLGMAVSGMIVFGGKESGAFWRGMISLLFVTVCFAGVLEAVLSIWHLPAIAGMALAALILKWGYRWIERRMKLDGIVEAELFCAEKTQRLRALVDSGNQLFEPLTGHPVSIVDSECILPLFEQGWEEERGYFLIPYHSIGTEKGWLRGVRIDRMQIKYKGSTAEINNPVLAIYEGQVSAGRRYQMILHPMHVALENRKQEEER